MGENIFLKREINIPISLELGEVPELPMTEVITSGVLKGVIAKINIYWKENLPQPVGMFVRVILEMKIFFGAGIN